MIKDRLLVSGQSSSPELVALQLNCRKSKLRLDRIGQFGIGVLSYFMLADHVAFRTRPSQESDPQDARGWEFETWGIGSFGELRPVEGLPAGTEVVLDLRPSFITSACGPQPTLGKLYEVLRDFVCRAIRWCPCAVELSGPLESCMPIRLGPGWTEDPDALTAKVVKSAEDLWPTWEEPTEPVLSEEELQNSRREVAVAAISREIVPQALRWFGPYEGSLPDSLGSYRVLLPYFELPGGACLAYLFREKPSSVGGVISRIARCHGLYPRAKVKWANSGFSVAVEQPAPMTLTGSHRVTLNIRDSAKFSIDVNRLFARLDPSDSKLLGEFVRDAVQRVQADFMEEHQARPK